MLILYLKKKIQVLQDSLRILGLYGLLKPLDLIQAYRLEMEQITHWKAEIYMNIGNLQLQMLNKSCKKESIC
jgi:cytoplasmic iron level regulating protein YaaA (DUF328/UPF0246 family)